MPNRVNQLLTLGLVKVLLRPAITGWLNYFNAEEALPNKYNQIVATIIGSQSDSYQEPENLFVPAHIITSSTSGLQKDQPVVFADSFGGIIANQVYYIIGIMSSTQFIVGNYVNGPPTQLETSSIVTNATQTVSIWDYKVADIGQRDNLIGVIIPGQLVLVESNLQTNSLWTIWEYTTVNSSNWNLIRVQSYKTANYWQYTNWYAVGYSPTTQPDLIVDTLAQRDSIESSQSGTVVKVNNGGDGNWQWYAWASNNWILVAQQNGSIEIFPTIYDWSTSGGAFDATPFDGAGTDLVFNPTPSFDDNAASEFSNIIDGIYVAVYPGPESAELNTLFFAMINYVVAEQVEVDWVFKTSNMVFTGFNQNLGQPPLLAVDNTNSILSFINEAKPYHANIQDYINGYTAADTASASVVDFDVPYPGLTANTPISAISPTDITLETAYNTTYTAWFNNYQSQIGSRSQFYLDPSLIRSMNTKMIFDRISTPSLFLGWDSIGWSLLGWDSESSGLNYGAVSRIQDHYSPTPGMIPNVISDLMQGVLPSD